MRPFARTLAAVVLSASSAFAQEASGERTIQWKYPFCDVRGTGARAQMDITMNPVTQKQFMDVATLFAKREKEFEKIFTDVRNNGDEEIFQSSMAEIIKVILTDIQKNFGMKYATIKIDVSGEPPKSDPAVPCARPL